MMEITPNNIETIQEQYREKDRIQKRAERFAILKKEKGISFEKMSDDTGVSVSTLKRFEKTTISIRDGSVKKVAQYLGVRFEYLAGYDDDKTEEEHLKAMAYEKAQADAREYVRLHRPFQIAREQRSLIIRVLDKAGIKCNYEKPESITPKFGYSIPEYSWVTGEKSQRNEWVYIRLTDTEYEDDPDNPYKGEELTYREAICSEEVLEAILDDVIEYAEDKLTDYIYRQGEKLDLYEKMKMFVGNHYNNRNEKERFVELGDSFYSMLENIKEPIQEQESKEESTNNG